MHFVAISLMILVLYRGQNRTFSIRTSSRVQFLVVFSLAKWFGTQSLQKCPCFQIYDHKNVKSIDSQINKSCEITGSQLFSDQVRP